MTRLERLRDVIDDVDERLATGSDADLVALAGELEARLAVLGAGAGGGDGDDDDDARERLAWRAERLAFVLRALDL